jgi:hypothetical protein
MPELDLIEQGAVVFHLLSIGGRHNVHRAQKHFRRYGSIAQQPVHKRPYGNLQLLGEGGLMARDDAGPLQNLLVCLPSPHGSKVLAR